MDNVTLKTQIESRSKEVFTDSYTLSLSELANRYESWDIVIPPKLQRVFRWSKYQKSRLIESLLLKIPIPAIFVSEDEQQRYEIIDGLQRMSTIFEFMGILKDLHDVRYPISNGLIDAEYLDLNWMTWKLLDEEWKRRIKNTRITLNIIQKDSDPSAKFDLFSRLNDWWTQLSTQETRNCIILMVDESFYDWLAELAENADYKAVMNFSDKSLETKDDFEFILRYLCTKLYDEASDKLSDVKTFIDNKTKLLIKDDTFDRDWEKIIFERLFSKLNICLQENSFHKFSENKFTNRFNYPWFDAIAQWLAYNFWENILNVDDIALEQKIKLLWSEDFNRRTDANSWTSSDWKLKYCASYGKTYFSDI